MIENLNKGDIVFSYLKGSIELESIARLCLGWNDQKINHMGIYIGDDTIIEAVSKGVVKTSVSDFINKSESIYIADVNDKELAINAVTNAIKELGKPYNFPFLNNNGESFYCSQLIYECYKYKNGETFFEMDYLKFKDPQTGELIPFFIEYYDNLGVPIPLGEKGTHPATLSKNKNLTINQYSNISEKK